MIIHLRLFDRETIIINKMKERGYPVAETIRQAIRDFGREEFPEEKLYAKVAAERLGLVKKTVEEKEEIKTMTNEQYATEVLRGKIIGDQVEFRGSHGEKNYFPLATIKTVTPENEWDVTTHLQLLNRTFAWVNGQRPTEQDYEMIFQGWEDEAGQGE